MPFTRLRQSLIQPNGSITGSLSGTSSYSRRALTASYALNASGGSISYITGSPVVGQYIVVSGSSTTQYALIQSVSNPEHLLVSVNGVVQNYSSSYTVTGSTLNFYQSYDDGDEIDVRFLNGGTTVQTGSIAKQTLWTNVTSGSTNTISGLSLSSNKWDVSVVEEWDAATLDQYYNSCSLLCHFDTINSAGRFIDNSRNNFVITSSGNVTVDNNIYKFGGGSAYFDGTGDYLVVPTNSALDFGTGDFTVEGWVLPNSLLSDWFIISSSGTGGLFFGFSSATTVGFGWGRTSVAWDYRVAGSATVGVWQHVAVTRSGTSMRLFVNGVQSGTTQTVSTAYNLGVTSTTIGSQGNLYYFTGYMDELRITKGVARYTANFTPQKYEFPNSRNQVLTRYVGLVGGIDDKYVDYGVQKLSNSSLKLTRLTYPNQPLVGSGSLSGSVSRVYVNVLDYDNVSISGSISNAVTASYALTSSTSRVALSASYLIPTSNNTTKAIFGYGSNGSAAVSMTNLVSNTGVVANDTTGIGTSRYVLAAAGYGTDKAIFGYGYNGGNLSMTNLVSNTGVVATDTTGVGTARYYVAAAGYGSDKAIFGYGFNGSTYLSMTNLVSNTGVVAIDTTGVGTARRGSAAAGYGTDKAIFGYGYNGGNLSITNLVSNTGVVATDTTGVGTARTALASTGYGTDKAIFGYGYTTGNVSMTNLVSNTGVVATDTTGVGTSRAFIAAARYGGDKAIFGYGYTTGVVSMTNLVSNTGVVANDTTGVGTARESLAAAGYSTS
jgi:hypothetical protein